MIIATRMKPEKTEIFRSHRVVSRRHAVLNQLFVRSMIHRRL